MRVSCHSLLNPDARFTRLTNRHGLTVVVSVCVLTSFSAALVTDFTSRPYTRRKCKVTSPIECVRDVEK
jgi:hypothetical protein